MKEQILEALRTMIGRDVTEEDFHRFTSYYVTTLELLPQALHKVMKAKKSKLVGSPLEHVPSLATAAIVAASEIGYELNPRTIFDLIMETLPETVKPKGLVLIAVRKNTIAAIETGIRIYKSGTLDIESNLIDAKGMLESAIAHPNSLINGDGISSDSSALTDTELLNILSEN